MRCWEPTALRGAGTQLLVEADAPAQRLGSTALPAEAAGGSSGQFAAEKGEKSSVSRCAAAEAAGGASQRDCDRSAKPPPEPTQTEVLSRFLGGIPHAFVLPLRAEPIPKRDLKQKQATALT